MKTFEERKEEIKANQERIMQQAMEKIKNGNLNDWDEGVEKNIIIERQRNIENIDEVTTIDIGAETNSLIEQIKTQYEMHLVDYYQDFERFINEYIFGLNPDGKPKDRATSGKFLCMSLGVGANELLCFKGKNPMKGETGDLFKQTVNHIYGTNIPMSDIENQAHQAYKEAAYSGDELEKAQAFMHLREIQRDAGKLKNGGSYHLLAYDQLYQEAKAICTGRQR